MSGRGGRGGGRGGRGGAFGSARGTVTIAGTELNWDLTGLDIQKGPAERFPVCASISCRVARLLVLYATRHQMRRRHSFAHRRIELHYILRLPQEAPPPQAPPPTFHENAIIAHCLAVRDRIHEGPFYTILNDGMKNGLKRKASEPAPTEASLFNPFTDNQTYSAKYLKVRRRLPKLDARPYGESI
jgi:DNA-directed RNA polymerase III subunit RPC7